jgi:hypothetical protein
MVNVKPSDMKNKFNPAKEPSQRFTAIRQQILAAMIFSRPAERAVKVIVETYDERGKKHEEIVEVPGPKVAPLPVAQLAANITIDNVDRFAGVL